MELLTKLEELVLIAVLKLKDEAYGISVYKFIACLTGKEVTVSSVYFPLERLVRKGFLMASKGKPTPRRGGMSKRYYKLTKSGIRVLQENLSLNITAWEDVSEMLKAFE
ncbi:MAG: helix-turn-helix transcriptional regulator [Candidatus Aminicenantes bacterium]|nr:helix-turn-helix transcriptional regulator [Candidatus Aminicenantes bacterium]